MENSSSDSRTTTSEGSSFHFDDNSTFKNQYGATNPNSIINLQSKNKLLSAENTKLKSEVKDLRARLELSEAKYNQNSNNFENELNNAQRMNQETKKELIDTAKDMESKLNEQTKLNSDLSKANKQLKHQIETFLAFISSKSNQKVENLKDASNIFSDVCSSTESSSDKIKFLEEENSSLMFKLDESSDIIENKSKETHKLKKKLRKIHQSAQNQIEPERIVSEVAHKMTKSHKKQMKEAQSIISDQNEKINQLQTRLDQNMKQKVQNPEIKSSGSTNSTNFNNGVQYNNCNNTEANEAKVVFLENRLRTTEQILNDKADAIHTLQETIDELKEKCNELTDQLQESQVTVTAQKDMINDQKEKMRQVKMTIQGLKDEIGAKDTEIQELDTTIHEIQLKMSDLEAEKQQAVLTKPKAVKNEPTILLKEKLAIFETRVESLENLILNQSKEITDLHEQRKQMISKLLQVDEFLSKNENIYQILLKSKKAQKDENTQLKCELKIYKEQNKSCFDRSFGDCLEIVPKELVDQLKECQNLDPPNVLRNFVQILVEHIEKVAEYTKISNGEEILDNMTKRYSALLEHLQNACRILRTFANSNFNKSDDFSKTDLLTTCARIGKFIQEQQISLPIADFRPSIFEPKDLNDPQKVANVFLDFVSPDFLEKTPTAELFTLFMCVSQVNQILINNIDSNRIALQQTARISQLEDEHVMQIRELESWKNQQMSMNESLKPILSKLVECPPEEYYELATKVVDAVNSDDVGTFKQNRLLIEKVNELESQLDKLHKEIDLSHEKQEVNRQQFCKKADHVIDQLQKEIENQTTSFNSEKSKLQNQLANAHRILDEAQISYDTNIKKAQRKLQKRDDLINSLRSENENLSQKSTSFQNQLCQHQSQVDEDNEAISSLRSQLRKTSEQLQRMTAHKAHYKQRLMEADTMKSSTLNELKQRSEDLTKKYSSTINNMENELVATKEALESAQKELKDYAQKEQSLILQNAKLQMMERTSSLKLTAANEALTRERSIFEARQQTLSLALKAKNDVANAEEAELRNELIRLLSKIMVDELCSNVENDDDLNLLIGEVYEALETRKAEQFAIADALKLRRLLRIKSQESLIDVFQNLEHETKNQREIAETARIEANGAKIEMESLMRGNQRLERAATELNDWIAWSRSLLRQVSETASLNPPANEVRFVLEEALLASLGLRDVRRKVEILRLEKKMLLSQKLFAMLTKTKRNSVDLMEPIKSIRPIILSIIYGHRIQALSGNLPAKYNSQ